MLRFEGSYTITASRDKAWRFFTDPYALRSCLPELELLETVEPDLEFRGIVAVSLGGNSFRFPVRARWVERIELERGRIAGVALVSGTPLHFSSEISLKESREDATQLDWWVETKSSDRPDHNLMVQMMGNLARKAIRSFFHCTQQQFAT